MFNKILLSSKTITNLSEFTRFAQLNKTKSTSFELKGLHHALKECVHI